MPERAFKLSLISSCTAQHFTRFNNKLLTYCIIFCLWLTIICCCSCCVPEYSVLPKLCLRLCCPFLGETLYIVVFYVSCFHNPVEVPTCHGAFVRINIYLSCSLSCCHVACLVDGSEGVHPDDKGMRAEKKSNHTKDSPSVTCMTPCWVSCMYDCGLHHPLERHHLKWMIQLSVSQQMHFIVTFSTVVIWILAQGCCYKALPLISMCLHYLVI